MADSHDGAYVDVIIELKQSGMDQAKDINDQLNDLNATAKDLNSTLERMSDRAHADALALLQLGAAATVAKGAVAGGGVMGFVSSLAQMMPGGTVMGYAILGVIALSLAFAPFVLVLAGAIALMTAFLAGAATLATVAFLGFGAIGALAAGVYYLGNRTTAGAAAMTELKADITAMADVLSNKAAPMMIQMVGWFDRFIPQIQKAGLDILTWFGQRLPALFPIMTTVINTLAGAFGQMVGAMGKVVDYVIAHPQLIAFFQQLVGWGTQIGVGLLGNLLKLSDWFLQRLPQIERIALPIFGGIGNAILTIGTAAGNVVDWFLKHWPALTKAAGDAWAGMKQGWDLFYPGIKSGLDTLNQQWTDVVRHLGDLKPLLPIIGGLFGALATTAEGVAIAVLAVAEALERIVAAMTWLVAHKTDIGNVIGNLFGAGGGIGGGTAPNFPKSNLGPNSAGGPAPAIPGQSWGAGPPKPSSMVGGATILPIVYHPLPISREQLVIVREGIRRLNAGQQGGLVGSPV